MPVMVSAVTVRMLPQARASLHSAGNVLAVSVVPGMAAVCYTVVAVPVGALAVLHLTLGIGSIRRGTMVPVGQGRDGEHPRQDDTAHTRRESCVLFQTIHS